MKWSRSRFFRSACWLLLLAAGFLGAEDKPTFRTDGHTDETLPWFQLQSGEFPAEGSAHAISGELIHVDHLERQFILRVDRTDGQRRSQFDLALAAGMLPFGEIRYHGAPAALEDIPLGTHLHGLFYEESSEETPPRPLENVFKRPCLEAQFTRCFLLEDNFSRDTRLGRTWKVEGAAENGTIQLAVSKEKEKPQTFQIQHSTRVWKGKGFGGLELVSRGQEVLFDRTWATLYGPGNLRALWVDEESRKAATAFQLEKHRTYLKQRGVPGWVDEVDNEKKILTITLFSSSHPSLLKEITPNQVGKIVVARPSLMTYDLVNDRTHCFLQERKEVPKQPGSAGVQIRAKMEFLLEGHRPGSIVRVFPKDWPLISLPLEERYFNREHEE